VTTQFQLINIIIISSFFSFPTGHPVAVYVSLSSSRHLYPSLYLSFNRWFQKAVPTQDVSNPVTLPSFHFMYDISFPPWSCIIILLFRIFFVNRVTVTVLHIFTSALKYRKNRLNISVVTHTKRNHQE